MRYIRVTHESAEDRMADQQKTLLLSNLRLAKLRWGPELGRTELEQLRTLSRDFRFSVAAGDLLLLRTSWYITNTGLLHLATRRRCRAIHVQPLPEFSDATNNRYAFTATVYKSTGCQGFVGHGDADPSNVSPLVHGAEMRVAETRAVNRALRKAYGIGICSVEEVGSFVGQSSPEPDSKKRPLPANGNGNGNFGGRTVRDRLCQLIRQHQLDAGLVKSYATEFCGVKVLRDATRDQVESFIAHLAEWAKKDRNALLCQLNSYSPAERGAA
jgi:hypothetical protein